MRIRHGNYERWDNGLYLPATHPRVLRPKRLNQGVVASGASASGPIAPLVHAAAAGNNSAAAVTAGINTTGATLLVVGCSNLDASGTPVITDSKSNTWTQRTAYSSGSTTRATIFYVANPPGGKLGSAHTFTGTLASGFVAIDAYAFSFCAAVPFDVENGRSAEDAHVTQPGTVTPTNDNSLIVTCLSFTGATTATINQSFTNPDVILQVGGQNIGISVGYLIQTAKGAVNPTWTYGLSDSGNCSIAVFKHS
jgi:hypothetical protein